MSNKNKRGLSPVCLMRSASLKTVLYKGKTGSSNRGSHLIKHRPFMWGRGFNDTMHQKLSALGEPPIYHLTSSQGAAILSLLVGGFCKSAWVPGTWNSPLSSHYGVWTQVQGRHSRHLLATDYRDAWRQHHLRCWRSLCSTPSWASESIGFAFGRKDQRKTCMQTLL